MIFFSTLKHTHIYVYLFISSQLFQCLLKTAEKDSVPSALVDVGSLIEMNYI